MKLRRATGGAPPDRNPQRDLIRETDGEELGELDRGKNPIRQGTRAPAGMYTGTVSVWTEQLDELPE